MILSFIELTVLVLTILIVGAVSGVIFHCLDKRKHLPMLQDFSNGIVADKMIDVDVKLDEIVKEFHTIQ